MLIDQSNYRVPKTLLVPQTEAQSGIETPCVPFHVGDSFTPCKGGTGTNSLLVPPNDASNALTLGSDGSYGGLGTSDTDNDAESIHRCFLSLQLNFNQVLKKFGLELKLKMLHLI